MDELKLVSIIVPVYNVEHYINDCLTSLVTQTYKNIEIIIVNDGSKDKSLMKIEDWHNRYKNIIKIIDKENGGLSSARNSGLDIALGEYISFVDSDDYIDQNTITNMVMNIEKYNCDIAICGRFDVFEDNKKARFILEEEKIYKTEEAINELLIGNHLDFSACDKLYKRELWEFIRFPNGRNNEDIATIPLIINKAKNICHVGKPLYFYRHRESSITTVYNIKQIKDYYQSTMDLESIVKKNYPNIKGPLIFYMCRQYYYILYISNIVGYDGFEKRQALKYLKQNWNNSYCRKFIPFKQKLVYYLMRLHLYKSILKLKNLISGGKSDGL